MMEVATRHDLIVDTGEDARVQAFASSLFEKLASQVGDRFDKGALQKIEQIIFDERARAKRHFGVAMPDLVVLPLPRMKTFEIVRRDLDGDGIQRLIRRLAVKYADRGIQPDEVVFAVRYGFPNHRNAA